MSTPISGVLSTSPTRTEAPHKRTSLVELALKIQELLSRFHANTGLEEKASVRRLEQALKEDRESVASCTRREGTLSLAQTGLGLGLQGVSYFFPGADAVHGVSGARREMLQFAAGQTGPLFQFVGANTRRESGLANNRHSLNSAKYNNVTAEHQATGQKDNGSSVVQAALAALRGASGQF